MNYVLQTVVLRDNWSKWYYSKSDHFPVFSTLKMSQEKYYDQSPYEEISRRQMKQENKDSLMNDLKSCNWEFLSEFNTRDHN